MDFPGDHSSAGDAMARSEIPEKNMIIDEWDRWAKNNIRTGQRADDDKALAFYGFLASERPRLLGFSFAGDKRPMVRIWLRQAGRISD
jgi:hypothetical protein